MVLSMNHKGAKLHQHLSTNLIMQPYASSFRDYIKLTYIAGGHPMTQIFSQRIGAVIAWLCQNSGLTPNKTTALAGLLITAGAWGYAVWPGNFPFLITILLLFQLAYATDCADGQLARATQRTSKRGAWWDVFVDFYSISVLSLAILWHLLYQQLPPILIVTCVMTFTFARSASLFSSTMVRTIVPGSGSASSHHVGLPQQFYRLMIDTPFLLLCITLLRDHPVQLISYLFGVSGLLIIHGVYIGLRFTKEV